MRVRGRGRHKPGEMNSLEAAYAAHLEARRAMGEIARYDFEPEKLRLADRSTYCPDFRVMLPDGAIEFHEVKPRMSGKKNDDGTRGPDRFFAHEDAKLKVRLAAELHPYRFVVVWPKRGGDWECQEF